MFQQFKEKKLKLPKDPLQIELIKLAMHIVQ
jgi:hypothetical protein